MSDLNESIDQIAFICPDVSKELIKKDLIETRNVEHTLNRILDGSVHVASAEENTSSTDTNSDSDPVPTTSRIKMDVIDLSETDSNSDESLPDIPFTSRDKSKSIRHDFISDSSDVEIEDAISKQYIPLKDRILHSPNMKRFRVSDTANDENKKPLLGPIVLSDDSCGSNIETGRGNEHPVSFTRDSRETNFRDVNCVNTCTTSKTSSQNCGDGVGPNTGLCSNDSEASTIAGGEKTSKVRKRRTPEEIAEQRKLALLKKEEREKAKEEKEMAKKDKQMLREREMKLKKQFGLIKDSLGFLKVILDTNLVNGLGLGAAVMKSCESLGGGLQCLVENQLLPYTVTWRRCVTNVSDGSSCDRLEDELVGVIPLNDFIQMVHNYKQRHNSTAEANKTLNEYILCLQQHFPGCQITPVVIGAEKYFRGQKTNVQRKYREAVTSEPSRKRDNKGSTLQVSRVDTEEAVTYTQLQTNCIVKFLETNEEFADLIKTFTKAVAEKPAKKDRLNSIFSFHEEGCTGVRVDKSGNGLRKVWKQQLMQFKNISPDIADAIVALYPSPYLLIQAYKQCISEKEGIQVLENIQVRRGAGVLETNRRIGKEMSKRIYSFFMCEDPNFIIK